MATVFNVVRQCGDKIRYHTKAEAKQHAAQLEQRLGTRLRAYHCPHCDKFHLGNTYHQRIPITELRTELPEPPPPTFEQRRATIREQARLERQHRIRAA